MFHVVDHSNAVLLAAHALLTIEIPTYIAIVLYDIHLSIHTCIYHFLLQVLFHINDIAALLLYAVSCLIMAVVSLILPIETKGKSLKVYILHQSTNTITC